MEIRRSSAAGCRFAARPLIACRRSGSLAYESEVDPRLNYEKSLELAILIARRMQSEAR
jgi:3-deoxy-D-arabino-heptulosonate 7-phosphate (DAHP) synthase class II